MKVGVIDGAVTLGTIANFEPADIVGC